MYLKLTLFTLSSLTVFAMANALESRQATACGAQQGLQCCDLKKTNDGDAQQALLSAGISPHKIDGLVGLNCVAATPSPNQNNPCVDGKDLGCCPVTQPDSTVNVNCTSISH